MAENNTERNVSLTVIDNGKVTANQHGSQYATMFSDWATSNVRSLVSDVSRDVHATLEKFEDGSYSLTFKSLPK